MQMVHFVPPYLVQNPKHAITLSMKEQIKIQQLLNQKLLEIRGKNPSFSIRAFAKKLNLHPSATNEILKGQRKVSRKMAEKIADALLLDPTEKSVLLQNFPEKMNRESKHKNRKVNTEETSAFIKLSADQFALISEGIHFALLSLIKTEGFQSELEWMAERLGETKSSIQKALQRLMSLHLIKLDKYGNIVRTCAPITTSDDTLNLSLQKSHIEDMEIAKEKLLSVDVKKRDFTSLTLPVEPELLPKAKEILRNAQLQLEELMEGGKQQEVYKLSMYLYPLTELQN